MKNVSNHTQKLTFTALMVALTAILAFTPLGMIRLPMISLTIAHIPTIVAAMVLGLRAGVIVGTSFGIMTLIIAVTSSSGLLDPLFINPLISVLPRALIGVMTYLVYTAVSKINRNIAVPVASVMGNLTNAVGVLGMLALIHGGFIMENMGQTPLQFIIGVMATSTVFETVATVVISTPIVLLLRKIYRPITA